MLFTTFKKITVVYPFISFFFGTLSLPLSISPLFPLSLSLSLSLSPLYISLLSLSFSLSLPPFLSISLFSISLSSIYLSYLSLSLSSLFISLSLSRRCHVSPLSNQQLPLYPLITSPAVFYTFYHWDNAGFIFPRCFEYFINHFFYWHDETSFNLICVVFIREIKH